MGYQLLRRGEVSPTAGTGEQAAPTSGQTITLWSSADNVSASHAGARWKRLVINVYSSHASATDGLKIEESQNNSNWRTLKTYTIAATTYTKNYVAVSAPFVRATYENSANTLTAWEMSVLGDADERSAP